MHNISKQNKYRKLLLSIGDILREGRKQAYKAVNNILTMTYWEIGELIIKFEQKGKLKADYGSQLLLNLSKELKTHYGKGFSRSNLTYMRLLYIKYPKSETLSHQLSWSHYFELLKIENDPVRNFYEKQCVKENWSIRELKRQKNSMLFERIALSKNKKDILNLAEKGQITNGHNDIIKDPYVLEFLGLPENYKYSEKELEQKIIDNLQMFLLELGKGFTFVKRQFRITLNNRHFYIDLVFYHRVLRCFVLIDLKIHEVDHSDIGQMNMYLNYFKTAEKEHISVKYALGGISNKLFVSKYQLYLPKKEELEEQVGRWQKGTRPE